MPFDGENGSFNTEFI